MSCLVTNFYRLKGDFFWTISVGGYDFLIAWGVFLFVSEMIEPFAIKSNNIFKEYLFADPKSGLLNWQSWFCLNLTGR